MSFKYLTNIEDACCIGRKVRFFYICYVNEMLCPRSIVTWGFFSPEFRNAKGELEMSETTKTKTRITPGQMIRFMTVTAMLSAIAYILMFFDFSIPLVPSFLKMDLSDLPELIGAFSMGPTCGVCVCLIKNLLHLTQTSTGGVGELSNFLLGVAFVLPGGLLYRHKKTKKVAICSSLLGAFLMAAISIVSNYFIVYPIYYNFMPKEVIIGMYNAVLEMFGSKKVLTDIMPCLVLFNAPFTFVKGLFSVIVTMFVYKPLSPILKGKSEELEANPKEARNGIIAIIAVAVVIVICIAIHLIQSK